MALVRILVDGYSLLHNWPELAPGRPRHSEQARDALVRILTRYYDATGDAITVFFDGAGAPPNVPKNDSSQGGIEVLFSGASQTADDLIERVVHRLQEYGDVLVVTDDFAERAVVGGFGGMIASCENFIRMVDNVLSGFSENLENRNQTEKNRFKRPT